MAHTFDPEMADVLEDVSRYRYLSRDELLAALAPGPGDRILDLGSGTGFYTRDVAAGTGRVAGLDIQSAMHARHREAGVPANVDLVTGAIDALPHPDDTFDAAFSTMTFHEFATRDTLLEVVRVLRPGARLVTADWSAEGAGESGPPRDERRTAADAAELCETAGCTIRRREERPETFLVVAVVDGPSTDPDAEG